MIPVNVEDEDGMHKILIKSEDEEKEILVDLEEDLPPRYPFLYNLDFLSTF
jgi:hypothetical protein